MSETTTGLHANTDEYAGSRRRLHQILETAKPGDSSSRIVDFILILLISVSVVAVIFESVPAWEHKYASIFHLIETVSVAVFTVEYFLRVWCAVEIDRYADSGMNPLLIRLRFVFSPYAIIDFLAILPFYLLIGGFAADVDLRFLRCFRLLRVLKLTRYSSAFEILAATCRENTRPLIAAFFILMVVMLLAASGIYFFERYAQPVAFASIPDAMWWAVSTLTTVGYGDITPVTAGGKIFGAMITVIGIGMVALPTGILAAGYAAQTRLRSSQYRQEASQALDDGFISPEESSDLKRLRDRLSLSENTASQILDEERVRHALAEQSHGGTCLHCGAALTVK